MTSQDGTRGKRLLDPRLAAANRWLLTHPGVSVWVSLVQRVVAELGRCRASLAASGATFWLVIALFPAVIAAVSIFGLIVTPQRIAQAVSDLGSKGTGSLGDAISAQALELSSSSSTLSVGLVISVVALLWSVSNGSYNLLRAVRLAYGVPERGYLLEQARGFLGGLIGVLSLGVLALAVSRLAALDATMAAAGWSSVIELLAAPCVLALGVAILTWLYRFAIGSGNPEAPRWPGALLATIGLTGLGLLLYLAIAGFGSTSSVYGIAAGTVSALISAYTAIYLILLGAVVNAQWGAPAGPVPRGGPASDTDAPRTT